MSGLVDRALGAVITVGAIAGAGAFMVVVDVGWDASRTALIRPLRRWNRKLHRVGGRGRPGPDIDAHGPGYVDEQIDALELQFAEGSADDQQETL